MHFILTMTLARCSGTTCRLNAQAGAPLSLCPLPDLCWGNVVGPFSLADLGSLGGARLKNDLPLPDLFY